MGSMRMSLGCDIHTHAHAQDSLHNHFAEQMSTVGSLYNSFGQGYGYEYHSSVPVDARLFTPCLLRQGLPGLGLLSAQRTLQSNYVNSVTLSLENPDRRVTSSGYVNA